MREFICVLCFNENALREVCGEEALMRKFFVCIKIELFFFDRRVQVASIDIAETISPIGYDVEILFIVQCFHSTES